MENEAFSPWRKCSILKYTIFQRRQKVLLWRKRLTVISLIFIHRIAGWDVKKYPRLYDKFHIGDQVLSVNDVEVTDLSFTHKIVKHIKADLVEVTIRRLPNASAFAIQRSVEGENLGIKREGGTAEVCYMGLNATKPFFWVSNKAGLKPVSSATETS